MCLFSLFSLRKRGSMTDRDKTRNNARNYTHIEMCCVALCCVVLCCVVLCCVVFVVLCCVYCVVLCCVVLGWVGLLCCVVLCCVVLCCAVLCLCVIFIVTCAFQLNPKEHNLKGGCCCRPKDR